MGTFSKSLGSHGRGRGGITRRSSNTCVTRARCLVFTVARARRRRRCHRSSELMRAEPERIDASLARGARAITRASAASASRSAPRRPPSSRSLSAARRAHSNSTQRLYEEGSLRHPRRSTRRSVRRGHGRARASWRIAHGRGPRPGARRLRQTGARARTSTTRPLLALDDAGMFSISACKTPKDQRTFETLPESAFTERIQRSRRRFQVVSRSFSRLENRPSRSIGQIVAFLASEMVSPRRSGRRPAIVNRSHERLPRGSRRLLRLAAARRTTVSTAAHAGLRGGDRCPARRRMRRRTPRAVQVPSIHDDCGLLVGRAEPPGQPYRCRGTPATTPISWPAEAAFPPRARTCPRLLLSLPPRPARPDRSSEPLIACVDAQDGPKIRSFDMARLEDELRLTHRLYNCVTT